MTRARVRSGSATGRSAREKEMEMNRLPPAAILLCAAMTSCAGLMNEVRDEPPIAVLDGGGISAPALTVDSGGALTFLNGDSRAHQIYSPECPELDSTLL